MKFVLVALCAVVVITQAQNQDAVTAIKNALDNFPVETVVQGVKKVAKISFMRNEHFIKVLAELPLDDWDWEDAEGMADKLMPFEQENLKVDFVIQYNQLLDSVNGLKTTSVRDFILTHVIPEDRIPEKLFTLLDEEEGQYNDPDVLKALIVEFHQYVKVKVNDMNERINEWADEVARDGGRLRRELAAPEAVVEKWNEYSEQRQEIMEKVEEYFEMYYQLVEGKVMEQLNDDSSSMEVKRRVVNQFKDKINRATEKINECNIDEFLENYDDVIKQISGHLKEYESIGRLNIKKWRDYAGTTTVWDALKMLKGALMEATGTEGLYHIINEYFKIQYKGRLSEADYDDFLDTRLRQLGAAMNKWNEPLETYFQMFINHYNERFGGGRAGRFHFN